MPINRWRQFHHQRLSNPFLEGFFLFWHPPDGANHMSSKLYWRETIKHADSGNVNNDDDVDGHVSPASIRIRPTFAKEDPTKWRRSMNLSEGKKKPVEKHRRKAHISPDPFFENLEDTRRSQRRTEKLPRTKKPRMKKSSWTARKNLEKGSRRETNKKKTPFCFLSRGVEKRDQQHQKKRATDLVADFRPGRKKASPFLPVFSALMLAMLSSHMVDGRGTGNRVWLIRCYAKDLSGNIEQKVVQ